MNTLAAAIDECRTALAMHLRACGMPQPSTKDLNSVRAALFFYRQQRCPGVEAIEVNPSGAAASGDRLEHAAHCLESLLYDEGNSELQRRMLRGCMARVWGVIQRSECPVAPTAIVRDWRSAQLPTGDL